MESTTVKFSRRSWAHGRNGGMTCTGVDLFPISVVDEAYVELAPLTGRGAVSRAAIIHIPFEDVDAVYNALGKIRDEVRAKLSESES